MGAEMGVQNMCMEMAAEMAGKMALGAQTRTPLPVYFRFTSSLRPGNAQITDAGPLVPLDPIFFIF